MKILKLFKKYFCLTAVSIALLGLVLAGWKFLSLIHISEPTRH